MPQSEQRCDGSAILARQADLNPVAHTLNQVPEPVSRLWENSVTSPRDQHKPIEFVQKVFRTTHFVGKFFPFRPSDFPLNGVPVQSFKDPLQTRSQIEVVQAIRTAGPQTITRILKGKRSELAVPPPLAITFFAQPINEYSGIIGVVKKGLTMVSKRQ
jgi:hypothetical protein